MESWLIINLIAILILIASSAIFSTMEAAILSISKPDLYFYYSHRKKRLNQLTEILNRKDDFLNSLLLLNNAVNIFASSLATAFSLKVSSGEGVIWSSIIMTALIVIFAEIIPKNIAISNPERVAIHVAPFAIFIIRLAHPFSYGLTNLVRYMNKKLQKYGVRKELTGVNKISQITTLQHEEGNVEKSDRDMISGLVYLAETNVSQIMTHRKDVFMLDYELSANELFEAVLKSPHSRIPVYKDTKDNIVGVLLAKDLYRERYYNKSDKINLDKLLSPPWFIPKTTSAKSQLSAFLKGRLQMAVVVDEYGDVQGIVTLEDIVEEIIGDIKAEHEIVRYHIKEAKEGGYIVDGITPIRYLNRSLDWNLDDEDTATVAGYVMHKTGRLLGQNESCEIEGYYFKIVERKKRELSKILIQQIKFEEIHNEE